MHDVMTDAQFSKGHFGLLGYAKTTVLAIHVQCAVPHLREAIRWPRTEREVSSPSPTAAPSAHPRAMPSPSPSPLATTA